MEDSRSSKTILKHLSITIGEFKARYPTKEEWLIPSVSPPTPQMKITSVHRFFTSNIRTRGMAFYEAYEAAMESNDKKELCTNVASMLCDVYDGFRSSVEEALHGIGVIPTVVWLPSAEGLVWPFVLVNFGCLIIMLLKNFTDEVKYKTFMINFINELKEKLGYDADLDFPFDFKRAIAIKTNLGCCSRLRQDAIRFILKKSNSSAETDQEIGGVCHYLCNVLAWSELRHFTVIKEYLVKPQSLILLHPAIRREVRAFINACKAVNSHFCPQFFMCLAPEKELSLVKPCSFPTLITIAQELERRDNNSLLVCEHDSTSVDGADSRAVIYLVNLHLQLSFIDTQLEKTFAYFFA